MDNKKSKCIGELVEKMGTDEHLSFLALESDLPALSMIENERLIHSRMEKRRERKEKEG